MTQAFRGSSWYYNAAFCRPANRNDARSNCHYNFLGFRVAKHVDRSRVTRSGSWLHNVYRGYYTPTGHNYDLGFRVSRKRP